MGRPKGFARWFPQEQTLVVLGQVKAVLEEYEDYLPMTNRQIFYRLVGQYDYEKTEKAYKRLCEYLVRARRAGMISFNAIRDDGTIERGAGGWYGEASFWKSVRDSAESYEYDRQRDQPVRIELWSEAGGMAPMLENMTARFHIPIFSTGGFSSVTVTRQIAERVRRDRRPTAFLHVGDYDPSGESIFESMSEDVEAFLWGVEGNANKWKPERVALTQDQVEEHDLPTAPPKSSDSRTARWEIEKGLETTQAEAMPPTLLEEIVVAAVSNHIDDDILQESIERGERERERILEKIDDAMPEDDIVDEDEE